MNDATAAPDASSEAFRRRLIDAACEPYRRAGPFAWHFGRGKLGGDPAFTAILAQGLLSGRSRILDIGCGQGLLAAWLTAAARAHARGDWPADWPTPPATRSLRGLDLLPRDVERAQAALGDSAEFVAGDMREVPFGEIDAAVVLDVLHYVPIDDQDRVLERIRDALVPGGVLLLRVGDAAAGLPFRISNWVDRLVILGRSHGWAKLHCRSLAAWRSRLQLLGFEVVAQPMSAGTPFANVLLSATRG